MKKTICTIFSICMLLQFAKAQQATVGFTAGASFASYKVTASSVSITAKTKVGFTLGMITSFPMGNDFSLDPALHFTQKGGNLKEGSASDKSSFNYIEIPVNLVYNTGSSNGKFFVGGGPSLSMGISGKDKFNDGPYSEESKIKFGNSETDDLKGLDLGFNFLAGYQFKGGFLIAANYNMGLSNVAITTAGDDSKMHNRYFGLRLGYMSMSKKKK